MNCTSEQADRQGQPDEFARLFAYTQIDEKAGDDISLSISARAIRGIRSPVKSSSIPIGWGICDPKGTLALLSEGSDVDSIIVAKRIAGDTGNAILSRNNPTEGGESFIGKGALNEQAPRKRRSRHDVPWYEKREIDGYPVTRSLTKIEHDDLHEAWDCAPHLDLPLTVNLCFKPPVGHLSPIERMRHWAWYEQKIRSHCAWRRFPCAFIMSRESDPDDHGGEHTHWLVHAPDRLLDHPDRSDLHDVELIDPRRGATEIDLFIKVARGWGINGWAQSADQTVICTDTGREHSAISYMTKACPQAAFGNDAMTYRLSGALVGPRSKVTRNLQAKARQPVMHELDTTNRARARVRHERRLIAGHTTRMRPRDVVWMQAAE